MAARKKPPQTSLPNEPAVRFVITLGGAPRTLAMETAATLDLDRLPDAKGKIKLLVSAEDMQRLLDNGHQVNVTATVPVAPLDEELVLSDREAKRWLNEQVKGIPRKRGR